MSFWQSFEEKLLSCPSPFWLDRASDETYQSSLANHEIVFKKAEAKLFQLGKHEMVMILGEIDKKTSTVKARAHC